MESQKRCNKGPLAHETLKGALTQHAGILVPKVCVIWVQN